LWLKLVNKKVCVATSERINRSESSKRGTGLTEVKDGARRLVVLGVGLRVESNVVTGDRADTHRVLEDVE